MRTISQISDREFNLQIETAMQERARLSLSTLHARVSVYLEKLNSPATVDKTSFSLKALGEDFNLPEADADQLPPSLIPNSELEFTAFSKFLKVMPNRILTVKAMFTKKDPYNLHRWRWVWDGLKYSEKWGVAW